MLEDLDPLLVSLAYQRLKLLTKLARLLKWAGPHHPDRSGENHKRALRRKILRKQLKDNALAIASHVMSLVHGDKPV